MHLLSPPLTTDTPFLFLAQTLSMSQLYDPIVSLWVFFYFVFFQTCESTYKNILAPNSLPPSLTLLLLPHPKSLTHLLLFSLLLSFSFFIFFLSFFCSFYSCFFPSSFCFCHPNFPCFGLHYFLYFSEHLIIFISPVLQLISGLW